MYELLSVVFEQGMGSTYAANDVSHDSFPASILFIPFIINL